MADGSDGGGAGCVVLLAGLVIVYLLVSMAIATRARLDRIDQVLGLGPCEAGFLYVDCPLPKPRDAH